MVTLLEMRSRQVDRLQRECEALELENDRLREALTYYAKRGYKVAERALEDNEKRLSDDPL